jgi:hypothetical protein
MTSTSMRVWECDRCNKTKKILGSEDSRLPEEWSQVELLHRDDDKDDEFDLCERCTRMLEDLLRMD